MSLFWVWVLFQASWFLSLLLFPFPITTAYLIYKYRKITDDSIIENERKEDEWIKKNPKIFYLMAVVGIIAFIYNTYSMFAD